MDGRSGLFIFKELWVGPGGLGEVDPPFLLSPGDSTTPPPNLPSGWVPSPTPPRGLPPHQKSSDLPPWLWLTLTDIAERCSRSWPIRAAPRPKRPRAPPLPQTTPQKPEASTSLPSRGLSSSDCQPFSCHRSLRGGSKVGSFPQKNAQRTNSNAMAMVHQVDIQ